MSGSEKNLDNRLAESELKYQALFNHSFDAILLTAPDGRIFAANPAACKMFRRSEEEICRLGRNGIMSLSDQRLIPAIEQREISGKYAGELTGLRSDGTVFPVELSTSVFTDCTGEKRTSMIIRDISLSNRHKEEIEAGEAYMHSILENTDNYIWSIDRDFRFLVGNSAFQARFRKSTGRAIRPGDDVTKWMSEENSETWKGYYRQGISGISFTTMSSSGSEPHKKYLRYAFNPVRNLTGEVTGLTIMGTDVTDLIVMQKDLVRTGVMLKEAQSVAKLGNWEYDVGLSKADWSDELLRIFGLTRKTDEPSWESHLGRIHPDDVQQFKAAVMIAYSDGIPFSQVFRLQIPEEEIKWIRVICKTGKDRNGSVIRLYGTVQDITDQQKAAYELSQSEERYRNLFERSVVPIIEEDFSEVKKYFDRLRKRGVKDFRRYFTRYPERAINCITMVKIKDVNQTGIQFFGVKQKSDLIRDMDVFFSKESYKIFVEEAIALAEGRKEFECVLPVRTSPGQDRFIQMKLHVVPDGAHTLSQVLVSWIEITDRLRYEEGLKESREALRRLNMHIEEAREQERTNIAMNLHDDIGQQLTALKMNLSWLRKRIGVQSPLVSDKLDEVEKLIDNSVSTVQRISSELRPALLYELGLKDAVEWHMKQNLEPAGIRGSFRLLPADSEIDENLSIVLFRVIQEALTNIIRHSGASMANVTITIMPSFIELVIKDDGSGIDAESVNDPKSFGITSIRERVKNISGDFTITGETGFGTTLTVKIPFTKKQ